MDDLKALVTGRSGGSMNGHYDPRAAIVKKAAQDVMARRQVYTGQGERTFVPVEER